MKYDRSNVVDEDYGGDNVYSCSLSCAFFEARVDGKKRRDTFYSHKTDRYTIRNETDTGLDKRLWKALCEILTASETRPVFVPTTDLEPEWRDMVADCPYATFVTETKSKHGDYNAQVWVFEQHERNSE